MLKFIFACSQMLCAPLKLLAVLAGRELKTALEGLAESSFGRIADFMRNLLNRQLAAAQMLLRQAQAVLLQIGQRRFANHLAKQIGEL